MLESVKIQKRQSEIRQELSTLAAKESPDENEVRSMSELDREYTTNETRYRACLIAEDQERKEAGEELEERSEKEFSDLIASFELRQVALALDEGSPLSGQTAEVVQEMRSHGGYQGIPVPLMALEQRAGETIASGTPDPISTRPIIDRLFPASVMGLMGGQVVNITSGETEWPVATQGAQTGWATTEDGDVASPQAYQTIDRALAPDHNLGCQMTLTRKTMKQSGSALEQAVRRDMNSAIAQALDAAVFLGTGADGQPLGLIPGAATYGFAEATVNAAATYQVFRQQATQFLIANAGGYKSVRLLMRTELLDSLDDQVYEVGSGITDLDRLGSKLGSLVTSTNALAAPTGNPAESTAVMTTTVNGVSPFFVGIWGGVDLIRDPYTKAASGQLKLTGLVTVDVTASRSEQVRIIKELQ